MSFGIEITKRTISGNLRKSRGNSWKSRKIAGPVSRRSRLRISISEKEILDEFDNPNLKVFRYTKIPLVKQSNNSCFSQ